MFGIEREELVHVEDGGKGTSDYGSTFKKRV